MFQPHTVGDVGQVDMINVTVTNAQTKARFGGARADWTHYPFYGGALASEIWDDVSSTTPVPVIIGGDRNGVMTLVGEGSPEGVVIAPPTSVYYERSSAGVVLSTYLKNDGTGSTGWDLVV